MLFFERGFFESIFLQYLSKEALRCWPFCQGYLLKTEITFTGSQYVSALPMHRGRAPPTFPVMLLPPYLHQLPMITLPKPWRGLIPWINWPPCQNCSIVSSSTFSFSLQEHWIQWSFFQRVCLCEKAMTELYTPHCGLIQCPLTVMERIRPFKSQGREKGSSVYK